MLHHQRDHRPLAPLAGIQQPQHTAGVFAGLIQQLPPARHIGRFCVSGPCGRRPVGHQGLQQPHGVGSLAVPYGLDVRVRRRVDRGGDRHAVRQVQIRRDGQPTGPHDRLGIGSGQHAQPFGQPGQLSLVTHLEKQVLRAPGAGGHDQVRGGERAPVPAQPAAGTHGTNFPQAVGPLLESLHGRHRNNLCASRFRETEIVLQQRVLGAVAAARHAATAFQAAGPRRSDTTEIRVGHGLARRLGAVGTEEHPNGSRHPGVPATHLVGDLFDDAVRVGEGRVQYHAQHPLRLVVMWCQFAAPVGDMRPLLVGEERLRGHIQCVGVVQ